MRRARLASEEADLVLLVIDASRTSTADERRAAARLQANLDQERILIVKNKSDLVRETPRSADPLVVRVSALTGAGLDDLRAKAKERLLGSAPPENPIVSNARHASALERATIALDRATLSLDTGFTEEVVLEDLRAALDQIGEITGAFTTEHLFDRIFSTFCIGK